MKDYPHFSASELQCKCGCEQQLMSENFMEKLEALRVKVDFPLVVTSAYRCSEHNSNVSSTGTTGPHTTGRAVDIQIAGERAYDLLEVALWEAFTGVGISQKGNSRFIHLDDLEQEDGYPRPRVWSY